MSDFKPGELVRIDAPGDSEHGKVLRVHAVTESKIYVNVGQAVWMYFHSEVTAPVAESDKL